MSFRILGLDPALFRPLYGLSDAELARHGAQRMVAPAPNSFPDRIALRDLDPGETAILINYEHQPAATPFRSRHAIFVHEGAMAAFDAVDLIPAPIRIRPISLRAFDTAGMMIDADIADGTALEPLIARFFADARVSYLHAHFARRGCYAARIERRAGRG
jgi:hypothetical protein